MERTFTIIGGGIAGLTAAIALKHIGIEATVVEATPNFKPVGAGLALAANAMKAFHRLQIADDVIRKGRELKAFTIYDEQGKVISRTYTDPARSRHGISNFTIHRADLHEVLLSHIHPEQIITGKRSKDIAETKNGYKVFFDDDTFIETKYLIIAEGIHSPLRKKILPQSRVRYAGYICWRGLVDNTHLKIEETSETWGTNGRFGIAPLANNQIYWYACKNAQQENETYKNFTIEDLADNFKHYHQPITEIIKATHPHNLILNDISDLEPIKHYAFGNILLIGDAAHATTPNMGQGACMAIEDAVILANCLSKNPTVAEAFQSFEQRRLHRIQEIVNKSRRIGKIAQLESRPASLIRNSIFRLIPQRIYQQQIEKIYDVEFDS